MGRIVDKKGAHLALYIAAICTPLAINASAMAWRSSTAKERWLIPIAQFIAVCSASILAETLGHAALFRDHYGENGTFESGANHS